MTGDSGKFSLKMDGPAEARWTIALAHGAGADIESEFMRFFAGELAKVGFRVARFDFPYMAERRRTGKRRPPDRESVLRETWSRVIEELGTQRLVIGGKSMGGRIASLIADQSRVSGLVCLGSPFHPVGKPDRPRIDHLRELATPTLFLQGERDAFGDRASVLQYALSERIEIAWLLDGDHGFKPRKRSGRSEPENWREAVRHIERFVGRLAS